MLSSFPGLLIKITFKKSTLTVKDHTLEGVTFCKVSDIGEELLPLMLLLSFDRLSDTLQVSRLSPGLI